MNDPNQIEPIESQPVRVVSATDIKLSKIPFKCVVCNGFGTLGFAKKICHACKGLGYIMIKNDVDEPVG